MSTITKILLLVFAVIALLAASFLLAEESKEADKIKVPVAVIAAFQKSYPDAKISGYDKEVVNGKNHFEIETMVDSLEKTYVYLEDATLLQIEEEIVSESIPELVLACINKAYPKCEIDEADKITRGTTLEYEVVIGVGEKEMELLVALDGKILSSAELVDDDENEDEDEDEDDGEDEDTTDDDEDAGDDE